LAPTGREIAIAGGDGRIRDIYVLKVDGSGYEADHSRGVQNDDPQWSPDRGGSPSRAMTENAGRGSPW
jgi:hypothetical protein